MFSQMQIKLYQKVLKLVEYIKKGSEGCMGTGIKNILDNWSLWVTIITLIFSIGIAYAKLNNAQEDILNLEECGKELKTNVDDYKVQIALMSLKLDIIKVDIADIKDSLKSHVKEDKKLASNDVW